MIWARLDGPDTGALLPEVVAVVCSRVPRAEVWDRFVVCCCCCAVVEDDIDTEYGSVLNVHMMIL